MSGLTLFLIAVGGTGLACYFLTRPAQKTKAHRDSGGSDGGFMGAGDSFGSDGHSAFSRGGHDSPSSSDSGSSSDGGGGDGGGGGGGDGGGGGGGD